MVRSLIVGQETLQHRYWAPPTSKFFSGLFCKNISTAGGMELAVHQSSMPPGDVALTVQGSEDPELIKAMCIYGSHHTNAIQDLAF